MSTAYSICVLSNSIHHMDSATYSSILMNSVVSKPCCCITFCYRQLVLASLTTSIYGQTYSSRTPLSSSLGSHFLWLLCVHRYDAIGVEIAQIGSTPAACLQVFWFPCLLRVKFFSHLLNHWASCCCCHYWSPWVRPQSSCAFGVMPTSFTGGKYGSCAYGLHHCPFVKLSVGAHSIS